MRSLSLCPLLLLLVAAAAATLSASGALAEPISHFHVDEHNIRDVLKWNAQEPVTAANFRTTIEQWAVDALGIDREDPTRGRSLASLAWDDIAFEWIPYYLGSVSESSSFHWKSPCYGWNTITASALSQAGDATLKLSFTGPATPACQEEVYLIGTIQGWHFLTVKETGNATIDWHGDMSAAEQTWIHNNGFMVFRFNGTVDFLLKSLEATASLFLPADITREVWEKVGERNAQFLRERAYYNLTERTTTDVPIDESQIQEGDFLGVLRLDGLDPMLAWAMGSHTGHTTIALRFDGELYICESTAVSSYWPVNGIQKTPYSKWIQMAKEASYNVVHLPLRDEYRKKFNATAARAWFTANAEGLDYGYHNMLFGWIDLAEANYPGALRSQSHEMLIGMAQKLSPSNAKLLWTEALNKRIGTSGLPAADVITQAKAKGLNFTALLSVVEQDEWKYSSGYSMVCDVLVCETWKAGGIFGDMADSIQCTEFTNWDAYSLNIFDTTTPRPAECVAADPTLPYCQMLGKYRMDLPGYNTRAIFPGMAERCSRGSPPLWIKPVGC